VDAAQKTQTDLIGWIHTHPSQTAFLSSVDIHTQFYYQKLLPETVAIVYSPKFGTVKSFIITPGKGMSEIEKCKESGFHPHNEPVYQSATHIRKDFSRYIEICDLRTSSDTDPLPTPPSNPKVPNKTFTDSSRY